MLIIIIIVIIIIDIIIIREPTLCRPPEANYKVYLHWPIIRRVIDII